MCTASYVGLVFFVASMSKRSISIIAGVIAFVAAFYIGRDIARNRPEPPIDAQVVTRPWIEESLGPTGITLSVPWQLQEEHIKYPPEIDRLIESDQTLSHESDGMHIMAIEITFTRSAPLNLAGAADGAINNLKTVSGTESVEGRKIETSLNSPHAPAYEIDARITRTSGQPLRTRGILFLRGYELYQVLLICRDDQPLGNIAWEKLRNSIHEEQHNMAHPAH